MKATSKTISLKDAMRFTKKDEKEYFSFLNNLVDDLYEEAADLDWSWLELSKRSKVSYATVLNLGYKRTRFPRLYTIVKLGKALGWEINVRKVINVKRRVVG